MKYHIICGTPHNGAVYYVYRKDNGEYAAKPDSENIHKAVLFKHREDAEDALDQLPHGVAKHMSIVPLVPAESVATEIAGEPDTFEAHGYTWTRHTPGDPMPCDPHTLVRVLMRCEVDKRPFEVSKLAKHIAKRFDWSTKFAFPHQIIGWARV